jgi:Ca-activated chloride channel homolog
MIISHASGALHKSNTFPRYALVLVLALLLVTSCSSSAPPTPTHTPSPTPFFDLNQCSARSSTPITLTMYYGSEKQEWITGVVAQFNALHTSACDGPIHVDAIPLGSGESMKQILNGDRPDIWSPAARIWLNLLNAGWQNTPGNTGAPVETTSIASPSLVISPVVIAMWKSRAQALGWPNIRLGWSDIETLSTQGWAAYHHAELGMFQFAHTSPVSSNSGLYATIAEYYTALVKQSNLSIADVNNPQTHNFVTRIEHSIIYGDDSTSTYHGDSTGFLANTMCQKGQSSLSAAVLYENLVVEMNEGKLSSTCPEPVVAIYPKEGTLYSDHPFAIPRWVSSTKRTSALAFRNFLLAPEQQKKALLDGFRPVNLSIPVPTPPLDTQQYVNLAFGVASLQIPSLDVIQAIQDIWSQLRHKVAVMLLLDTSGSMNYLVDGIPKINKAKQSLKQFIGLLSDNDWVGLTTFSTGMQVLFQVAPLGSNRRQMLKAIDGITAVGSTLLYNSIADQVQALKALSTNYSKAVVVLTDGVDTIQQLSLAQLLKEIIPTDPRIEKEVRVFTIACGDQSYIDIDGLRQIAEVTGRREYSSTPQDIQQVYRQISQFF